MKVRGAIRALVLWGFTIPFTSLLMMVETARGEFQ